jgi:hypothetical protein
VINNLPPTRLCMDARLLRIFYKMGFKLSASRLSNSPSTCRADSPIRPAATRPALPRPQTLLARVTSRYEVNIIYTKAFWHTIVSIKREEKFYNPFRINLLKGCKWNCHIFPIGTDRQPLCITDSFIIPRLVLQSNFKSFTPNHPLYIEMNGVEWRQIQIFLGCIVPFYIPTRRSFSCDI